MNNRGTDQIRKYPVELENEPVTALEVVPSRDPWAATMVMVAESKRFAIAEQNNND